MTDLVLHLGVPRDRWDEVINTLNAPPFHLEVEVSDDDGWEAWGERLGVDANDEDTRHMMITFPSMPQGAIGFGFQIAAAATELHLVPMTNQGAGYANGTIVTLTNGEDWSEEVMAWHADGLIRTGAERVNLTTEHTDRTTPGSRSPGTVPQGDTDPRVPQMARALLEIGVLLGTAPEWEDGSEYLATIASIITRNVPSLPNVSHERTIPAWVRIAREQTPPLTNQISHDANSYF